MSVFNATKFAKWRHWVMIMIMVMNVIRGEGIDASLARVVAMHDCLYIYYLHYS